MPSLHRKAGELQHRSCCWRANRSSNSHHFFTAQPISEPHFWPHSRTKGKSCYKIWLPPLEGRSIFPSLGSRDLYLLTTFPKPHQKKGGEGPYVKYVPARVSCIVTHFMEQIFFAPAFKLVNSGSKKSWKHCLILANTANLQNRDSNLS